MQIFDYTPHISFKDVYYSRKSAGYGQGNYLNIYDALSYLKDNVLQDECIRIFANASFGVPKNNNLKRIALYLKGSSDQVEVFHIICEITDLKMYHKYAAHELHDVLYKKCFMGHTWPFMKPLIIYGPELLYSCKSLYIERWAQENDIVCLDSEKHALDYIANRTVMLAK